MRRIGVTFIACLGLAMVMLGAFVASSPGASADVPPGSVCLTPAATPGAGTPTPGSVDYYVTATLPMAAAGNANGLCVTLNGLTQSARLFLNAPGCSAVAPTPKAANSYLSADWGGVATPSANCVRPGENVVLTFKDGANPPAVGTVTWSMANGTSIAGSALLQFASGGVGGVAEPPDNNGALPTSAQSSSSSTPIYALFAAIAIVVAATVGAGWYVKRRRLS